MVRRYEKNSTYGKWENLMNKSSDNLELSQPKYSHKKTNFTSMSLLNTTRTLRPELDVFNYKTRLLLITLNLLKNTIMIFIQAQLVQ